MSLRRAIEQLPDNLPPVELTPNNKYSNTYVKMLGELGLAIHVHLGVREILEELTDYLKPEFPDARFGSLGIDFDYGLVKSGVMWNVRQEPLIGGRTFYLIEVSAQPLTQKLFVTRQDGWRGDDNIVLGDEYDVRTVTRENIVDSVARAYKRTPLRPIPEH